MEAKHASVMVEEVMAALSVRPDDTVVDATLGGAGHFRRLLAALGDGGTIVGIDADEEAVERARAAYAEDRRPERPVAHLVVDNFRNLARVLERTSVGPVDKALFDLGWSGYQVASSRGFSFKGVDQPLYMTYGSDATSAAEIINSASERELADLIFAYGEEQHARRIAKAIVAARAKERILTTGQLVAAIESAVPAAYAHGKIHPATKTFQALRIAANDEYGALKEGLTAALAALAPKGVIAVLTFHSGEDRIVKRLFRAAETHGDGEASDALAPSEAEIAENRRARSAKLRTFVKHAVSPVAPQPSLHDYHAA